MLARLRGPEAFDHHRFDMLALPALKGAEVFSGRVGFNTGQSHRISASRTRRAPRWPRVSFHMLHVGQKAFPPVQVGAQKRLSVTDAYQSVTDAYQVAGDGNIIRLIPGEDCAKLNNWRK